MTISFENRPQDGGHETILPARSTAPPRKVCAGMIERHGRKQYVPMPPSSLASCSATRSQRESMERVMARIFQQNRNWAGEHPGGKGTAEGEKT